MRKLFISLMVVLFVAPFAGSAAHAQIFTPEYHKRDAGFGKARRNITKKKIKT